MKHITNSKEKKLNHDVTLKKAGRNVHKKTKTLIITFHMSSTRNIKHNSGPRKRNNNYNTRQTKHNFTL
jgi:hypothetical protein